MPIPQLKEILPGFGRRDADDNVFADRQIFANFKFRKNDCAAAVVFISAIENEIYFVSRFDFNRRRRKTVFVHP